MATKKPSRPELEAKWQAQVFNDSAEYETLVAAISDRLGRVWTAHGVTIERHKPHPAEDFDPALVEAGFHQHPDGDCVYLRLEFDPDWWRAVERLQDNREQEGKEPARLIPLQPGTKQQAPRTLILSNLSRLAQQHEVAPADIMAKRQGTHSAMYDHMKRAKTHIYRELHDDFGFSHGAIAAAVGCKQENVIYWVRKGRAVRDARPDDPHDTRRRDETAEQLVEQAERAAADVEHWADE
jgi:hypothetical protein